MDAINPGHYKHGHIEAIDAIKAALGPDGFEDYLRGQVMKYAWRCRKKENYLQDLRKMDWYCQRLVNEVESRDVSEGCSDN